MANKSGLNKQQQARIIQQRISAVSYSGPLPDPETLDRYNQIVPNGAERIFAQFEAQTAHRHDIERRVVRSNVFCQKFGSLSAFVLGAIAIGGGLYLAYAGRSLIGFGAFFTGLSSLVVVYIVSKHAQQKERSAKQS